MTLIAIAVGVGVLAALYGVITMFYNAEKMDDMKDASKKIIEKRDKKDS